MPKIAILKFGGSSLADEATLARVAEHIAGRHSAGESLVVVVSAMGKTTQGLMAQAAALNPAPPPRELDMLLTAGERISMALLAMTLASYAVPAISLTGSQSGILTDSRHNDASIVAVRPERVKAGLGAGKVVIVAGYQGVSVEREITTLGRGGSDTTAVALGAALDAEVVELCSDVAGVFSADPHLCAQARLLEHIAYTPMRTLGWLGARVLKPEATAFAERAKIAIKARHHAQQSPSTRIGPTRPLPQAAVAIAHVERAAWIFNADGRACEFAKLEPILARAQTLTGTLMLSSTSGALIDWTFALPDAHHHLVQDFRSEQCQIVAASCVSLVGDDLLRETSARAHAVLKEADVAVWSEWHTRFHLSFVISPDQQTLRRAVEALETLTHNT